MTKPKIAFSIAALFAVCLLCLTDSFAQAQSRTQAQQSYDVILQIVVASNNSAEKSDVSQSLTGVVKKLRADFPFANYRLAATYMQRVSNTGTFESKGAAYESNQNQAKGFPTFSEWTVSGLQNLLDEKGEETIQLQSFRFGQRIPVTASGAVTYEQVGLTTRFSLIKNTPTIVGSVMTAKPDELMFLILTVKPQGK